MKNKILSLSAAMFALFLTGCDNGKTYESETLTEDGIVFETAFVPKGHGHDTAIGYNTGKGGGITITPINVTIPERFAIVFKCQHGKFVVDGSKGKDLYKRLERGDAVTISYREVYRATKTGTNLFDLHFLDAVKRRANS